MAGRSYRTRGRYRRRGRGLRFRDVLATLVFLGAIAGAVVILDAYNPQVFGGDAVVIDGDTIIMEGEKLRLSGIDAPELSQACMRNGKPWACGRESKQALRRLVRSGDLTCSSGGFDRYDRWLVTCMADGKDINAALVEAGWAVDYGGYGREEATARRKKSGIWQGNFENPQEWRHANQGDAAALPSGTGEWVAKLRKISRQWF